MPIPVVLEPLLYFVSYAAFVALVVVTVILAGFIVYRVLRFVARLSGAAARAKAALDEERRAPSVTSAEQPN
ncbi:MAG: hypothetical protein JO205_12820 [Pseudolabrys sp.]|nr:hypothetical protein [Pseudolabrys sp.]